MLDRYVELLMREEDPKVPAQEIAERQVAARALAGKDPRFEFMACTSAVSRRQFECAMSAPSVNAVEQCF